MTITATTTPTDREQIRAGFRTLRRVGYTARMGFKCCGTCASYELRDEDKVAYYSEQGNESYDEDGSLKKPLFISWTGDVNEIAAALQAEGLIVQHNNGDGKLCVEVFGAKLIGSRYSK